MNNEPVEITIGNTKININKKSYEYGVEKCPLLYCDADKAIKDLLPKNPHLENFNFITECKEEDYQSFEETVIDDIVEKIKKSEKSSLYPTMCADGGVGHIFGFICGRNKDNKPYILNYNYNQDDAICEKNRQTI